MARRRSSSDLSEFVIPSKDEDLIEWARKKRDSAAKINEFAGKQNLAFMLGQQWGVWDPQRRRFQHAQSRRGDPNAPVRVTINKIGGHVERTIARLLKDLPIPEARPVSDDEADLDTAKVATRILDHELNARLNIQSRLPELYFWVMPLGVSYLHVRWDPNAGAVVGANPDDPDDELHEGEIVLDEVPGFEIRVDPNGRRFRDAKWLVRDVVMSREAIAEQYGKAPKADDAEGVVDEWRALADGATEGPNSSQKAIKTGNGFVMVHQLWVLPSRLNPKGLVMTWAGDELLEGPMPFPYDHNLLPFVPFNLLPAAGGSPFGRTWVTDLVPMQRDYNDARSREAMIRRTLTPKIVAPAGAFTSDRLTSRVEVVEYNPIVGQAPRLDMPDGRWMAQFERAMDRVDLEIGERAGQAEVSQGRAATSAPAASIIALQEADETKLAISAKELVGSMEELGYQVLMLARQFWDEDRTIRTWSRDGVMEVAHFRGANIGEQLDVHVASGSALPRSKALRQQQANDLLANGVITDPRDYVKLLDIPGTDLLMETINKVAKQAEREHARLLAGTANPVQLAAPWHDHQAHVQVHNEFRMSEDYERLPEEQRAYIDAHVEAHEQQLQLQMMQAQMAQMMAGGPAAPGAPPPGGTTNPTGANGMPDDPMTGKPMNPNGSQPGARDLGSEVQAVEGVLGGTGNPGEVPGQSYDTVAYRTGN